MPILDTTPRHLIDAACARAVQSARETLLGSPFDPRDLPLHLIVVEADDAAEIPDGPPVQADATVYAKFVDQTTACIQELIVGSNQADGIATLLDVVVDGYELSLRQLAALHARTVIDGYPDADGRYDQAQLINMRHFLAGDPRIFGAIPVQWSDPRRWDNEANERIEPLVIAAAGWHPVASRLAAQQVVPQLELILAEQAMWRPCEVKSPTVVLTQADGLPTGPICLPARSH